MIVGPPSWNSVKHLDDLNLPEEDRNLIVTVHYYTPMDFTHQGASWAGRRDQDRSRVARHTQGESGYCDGFQTSPAMGLEERSAESCSVSLGRMTRPQWTHAPDTRPPSRRTAEKLGWGWAYWQFDSDFVLYDIGNDRWIQPIRDALISRETGN